jgi:hypothetical protein
MRGCGLRRRVFLVREGQNTASYQNRNSSTGSSVLGGLTALLEEVQVGDFFQWCPVSDGGQGRLEVAAHHECRTADWAGKYEIRQRVHRPPVRCRVSVTSPAKPQAPAKRMNAPPTRDAISYSTKTAPAQNEAKEINPANCFTISNPPLL